VKEGSGDINEERWRKEDGTRRGRRKEGHQ